MTFVKGQSGNSKGRPPKARALTTLLEAAGSATVEVDGVRISGKRLVPRLVWEGAATGVVTLPTGTQLVLEPGEWLQLVKWIFAQVDGPPKAEMEVSGKDGAPLLQPPPPLDLAQLQAMAQVLLAAGALAEPDGP